MFLYKEKMVRNDRYKEVEKAIYGTQGKTLILKFNSCIVGIHFENEVEAALINI